jgi:SOS-response transcriptional repressor LexA
MTVLEDTETPLRDREHAVLAFINTFFQSRGFAPTLREIDAACGFGSTATVSRYVESLIKHGYLTRVPGQPRSLQLTPKLDGVACDKSRALWMIINRALSEMQNTIRDLRTGDAMGEMSQTLQQTHQALRDAQQLQGHAQARERQALEALGKMQADSDVIAQDLATSNRTNNTLRAKNQMLEREVEDLRQNELYYQGLLAPVEAMMQADGYSIMQLREYVETLRQFARGGVR